MSKFFKGVLITALLYSALFIADYFKIAWTVTAFNILFWFGSVIGLLASLFGDSENIKANPENGLTALSAVRHVAAVCTMLYFGWHQLLIVSVLSLAALYTRYYR